MQTQTFKFFVASKLTKTKYYLHAITLLLSDSDVIMQAGSIKMTNSKGQEILYISPNRVKTNFRTVKLRGKAQALKSLQAKVPSIYYVSKRTEWVSW